MRVMNKYLNIMVLILFFGIFTGKSLFAEPSMIKPVVSLKGYIIENESGDSLQVKIHILREGRKIGIASNNKSDRKYFITGLIPGNSYNFIIEHKGEILRDIHYKAPNVNEYKEIVRNFIIHDKKNIDLSKKK
jgi:hypothetical protein